MGGGGDWGAAKDGERGHADGDREWAGDYSYGRDDDERSEVIDEKEEEVYEEIEEEQPKGETERENPETRMAMTNRYKTSESLRDTRVLISDREDTLDE